jgi:hypothetical protein
MHDERRQLDKRWGCWLAGGGVAKGGGGLMRGRGAGGWEATQQQAKGERLDERHVIGHGILAGNITC